jgi:Asp-tRNA(Asn)/Glu-tRNA(Gln) amidotransferase C subunit
MKIDEKYLPRDFDIDELAASVKLELSECERVEFLADICDMANYTYNNLTRESADGTLAISASFSKGLSELREDVPHNCELAKELLFGEPDSLDGYITVRRTVGSKEGEA